MNGEVEPGAASHLRSAFAMSRHSMLIADDQRRWVTGNAAACELLGIAQEEVSWHTMDEFVPPDAKEMLDERWEQFLANGAAEGWYKLYIPARGQVPVEFSATANVLPSRHLSVFLPADGSSSPGESYGLEWKPVPAESAGRLRLTDREREIMTLVASGLHGGEIAERLFLSPETIKSHVQNAMGRLGAHACPCRRDRTGDRADQLGGVTIGSTTFEQRELWGRYREGDDAARESLVLNYAPLVKVAASRIGSRLPAHVEKAELVSFGLSGLLRAIELFEPERGVGFESFAMHRIRGAMLDALRSLDWVPRRVRQDAREMERAEGELGAELGRPPSEQELADHLDLELAALRHRMLEIANSRIYSFDAPLPGRREDGLDSETSLLDVVPSEDYAEPQKALDSDEVAGALREMIAELPERQQFILSCSYREDLKLREIAEILSVTESRVSQLRTKALISLRAAIAARPGRS
jgi:RNA polymerase sigma factor for flagellar operon FliA